MNIPLYKQAPNWGSACSPPRWSQKWRRRSNPWRGTSWFLALSSGPSRCLRGYVHGSFRNRWQRASLYHNHRGAKNFENCRVQWSQWLPHILQATVSRIELLGSTQGSLLWHWPRPHLGYPWCRQHPGHPDLRGSLTKTPRDGESLAASFFESVMTQHLRCQDPIGSHSIHRAKTFSDCLQFGSNIAKSIKINLNQPI